MRKQLAFDIHPELHKEIKMLSAERGISITNWMHRAIIARIKKERCQNTKEEP